MPKVRDIYDALLSYEGNKTALYPIHKKLVNNPSSIKEANVLEWIVNNVSLKEKPTILDAGCGVGFGLLSLSKALNGNGVGISLSPEEIEQANQNAKDLGLKQRCIFKVQDFNLKQEQQFDLIIAIESLKHSTDYKKTVNTFWGQLKPEGKIILVEDFYVPENGNEKYAKAFQSSWHVPSLFTAVEMNEVLKENKLAVDQKLNLTTSLHEKSSSKSKWKMRINNFLLPLLIGKRKTQAEILNGSLIMDYFYATNAFEYLLMVIKKAD